VRLSVTGQSRHAESGHHASLEILAEVQEEPGPERELTPAWLAGEPVGGEVVLAIASGADRVSPEAQVRLLDVTDPGTAAFFRLTRRARR
jgi:hypothetical protein